MSSSADARERFEVLGELGRGGMGVVERAYDRVRQEEVARKRMLSADPDALRRFKREFRVMEELVHPNLVRLHELGVGADGLFFTMELLRGQDLRSYCRGDDADAPPTQTDRARISPRAITGIGPEVPRGRDAAASPSPAPRPRGAASALARVLPQLLEALAFLHASGVVHRDLKPSNVMVTADGQLKLLDFGVLSELGRRESPEHDALVGTVGYMSPEQLRGEPTTPASDLYALGVMLFQIFAGRVVFEGSPFSVLRAHLERAPPRLGELAPDLPAGVAEACDALLAKDPSARPTLAELSKELLPLLGARPASLPPPRLDADEPLGRAEPKRALGAALARSAAGEFVLVVVTGPSGSGKTTLAQWLCRRAELAGAVVLRGRGRPTVRVPFNAVDGAVDDLGSWLRGGDVADVDAVLGRELADAACAFPVLAPEGAGVRSAAAISRALVFDALARVLARVAEAFGVVLSVDDLQWADDDSCALLEHLADAAPSRLCILATLRDDTEASAHLAPLLEAKGACRVALGPLDDEALASIVQRVARAEGAELSADTVRRAASASAGRPFLAELTGRALARDRGAESTESGLARAILGRALADHGALIALLVASDGWLSIGALAELTDESVGAIEDAAKALAREGILRHAGPSGPLGKVALYHDVVNAAAVDVLTRAPRAPHAPLVFAHGRLADWLAALPDAAPEVRVAHLLAAERPLEAATHARAAAEHAERQRAHALAAEMYEIALGAPGANQTELLALRAAALESAGRYADAAKSWLALARASEGEARLDAELREAGALVAAHDLGAGSRRLKEALAAAGLPSIKRTRIGDATTIALYLAGPLPELPRRSAAPPALPAVIARCERDIRVAMIVAYLDPLAGTRCLQRARASAIRAGAREPAALCDWIFAYYALFLSARRGRTVLAERYIASARARVLGMAPSDRIRALSKFLEALDAERRAEWPRAMACYDEVIANAESHFHGTMEHALALMNRAQVDLFRQDFAALDGTMRRIRAVARTSPQTSLRSYTGILEMFGLVFRGRSDEARATRDVVLARLDEGGPNRLGHVTRLFGHMIEINGDRRGAHEDYARDLEAARRFGALRYMRLGPILAVGAMLEANALRRGEAGASQRRVRSLAMASLRAPPYLVGCALRAMAYAADARGDDAEARALLADAEREAIRYAQPVEQAVARYQLGVRLGGDEGRRLVITAREAARAVGASESVLDEDAGLRASRA